MLIHNKQVASAEGYYNESESIIQSANFNTTIFRALVCAVKYSNLKKNMTTMHLRHNQCKSNIKESKLVI